MHDTRTHVSTHRYFSRGELGNAHALAHRAVEAGRPQAGRRILGEWLSARTGCGSRWVHLQWHMALFEIATGRTSDAQARLHVQIVPAIVSGQAATDGPSLLWWLALAGVDGAELPWDLAREAALSQGRTGDPYMELHRLLALSGSGDSGEIDRCLAAQAEATPSMARHVLVHMGQGLRALAASDFDAAATELTRYARHVPRLGGSRAQNRLFLRIAELSVAQALGGRAIGKKTDMRSSSSLSRAS